MSDIALAVQVKKLHEDVVLPNYATAGAAAMDLVAYLDAPLTIAPGARALIPTGIAIALPDRNSVCILCARSGLSIKHGICLANGIGVIDSDYRGELKVALANISDTPYTVSPGERIAQMMFLPVATATLVLADTLDETARGAGGFGSTGRFL